MIRACVFDLGGVLLDFDFNRFYDRVLSHCRPGVTRLDLERLAEERNGALERGRVSFRSYYERFKDKLGLNLDLEEFTFYWNDIFWENAETIALLDRLSCPRQPARPGIRRGEQGVRLFLLSNTSESHAAWFRSRFGRVLEKFEQRFFSHELGEMKPAPEVFHAVEKASGLRPEEHVFIDDLEPNVQGAQALGWAGLRFTNAAALADDLASLGVPLLPS